jgi:hypothetical protein
MAKSKAKTVKFTLEQERKLFLTPCKSRDEVKAWIKYFLNLELPDITVSRYSDTNPLDVIWEVYRICVLKINPENIKDLLFVAGRGSGKTLGMAIAELMVLIHDKREVVHVGAIQNQAERCYAYQKNFLYNRRLKSIVMPSDIPEEKRILEKANMSKSIFNIGAEKLTLEVIPCTLKACLTTETTARCSDGTIKTLSSFKVGDMIQSPQGWIEVIDNSIEKRECLRVELDDGRVIEGTLDHKVWTDVGWVMLKDLSNKHEIL